MASVFHLLSQTTVLFRTKVCISGVEGGSVYFVSLIQKLQELKVQ